MSLMTWFRDYIYFPLGGSRRGQARTAFNITVVFVVSGLWHGAAWSFLVWGLLNAGYLIVERHTLELRERFAQATGLARLVRLRTMGQIVVTIGSIWFAHIFFRAPDIETALYMVSNLTTGWETLGQPSTLRIFLRRLQVDAPAFCLAFALIPITEALEYVQRNRDSWEAPPVWAQWSFDYALIFGIILLGYFTTERFVYFQF